MKLTAKIIMFALCSLVFLGTLSAQTKKNSRSTPTPDPTPESAAATPTKRNERPDGSKSGGTSPALDTSKNQPTATHFYEFTRPGFTYGRILIEHSDDGRGTISFLKDGQDELITDPIEISALTLAKIDGALNELTFLDSTEEYQYARDFSHLGNVAFTLRRDGRSRSVKYNWTENKAAKTLMDEYRRIGNEYTWKFEILLARQNLPLQTPSLMDAIDGYLKRNEISDPLHLLPFLTELSLDERLPLIARNRASKIIKEITKPK